MYGEKTDRELLEEIRWKNEDKGHTVIITMLFILLFWQVMSINHRHEIEEKIDTLILCSQPTKNVEKIPCDSDPARESAHAGSFADSLSE
jgi:hypothetical protein